MWLFPLSVTFSIVPLVKTYRAHLIFNNPKLERTQPSIALMLAICVPFLLVDVALLLAWQVALFFLNQFIVDKSELWEGERATYHSR